MIAVLVADDDKLFREMLVSVLGADDDVVVVAQACDGEFAIAEANRWLPDVILLDVCMPRTGGIAAARVITGLLPVTKIVMLTASDSEDDLYQSLSAGASGYLLKQDAMEGVGVAVRSAVAGQSVLSSSMAARLVAELSTPSRVPASRLSERQFEILQLVADGFTNREIAERLYLSPHTVKRHVANILARLHLRNRVDAALFAERPSG